MDFISHAVLAYLLGSFIKLDKKLLAAFVIGGIAPDLDVFIVWIGLIFTSPDLLMVHRGITHSPIFGFLSALAAMLLISRLPGKDIFRQWTGVEFSLSWPVAGLALAGVLMHLFLDYLITKGVPLLFPLDTARVSAELLFHYEFIISACSIGIALWLLRGFLGKKSVSRKANNRLLALFLIVLLVIGGFRVEGKETALALDYYGDIAENIKGDSEIFPDWGLFEWIILNKNESSFQVYRYNFLSNETSYLGSYPRLHVEVGSGDNKCTSDLKDAMHLADSIPKIALFRWRACTVAVNACEDNGSWLLEYYDPVAMVKAPAWVPLMPKQNPSRGPSIRVRVKGDQALII